MTSWPDSANWSAYEVSNFLPLPYAADATRKVFSSSDSIMRDSIILIAFILGLLAVGSLTLQAN